MRLAKGSSTSILLSLIILLLFTAGFFFTSGIIQDILMFLAICSFFLFCVFLVFFRDPTRTIGNGVVAVADGRIREILQIHDRDIGECTKISTFMNIHNVHVNRMPLDGTIQSITHYTGGHLPAFQKESERNERVVLLIQTPIGMIKIIQIAGTVARRIVPYVDQGKQMLKGEKIGLIRFGSRVDIYLPTTKIKSLTIQVHDRIKAGEDTIAQLNA